MKRVVTPSILAIAMSVAVAAETTASSDTVEEILRALGATEVECDDERSGRYEPHIAVRCGAASFTEKTLKKTWRKALRSNPLANRVRTEGAAWKKASDTERAMYVLADGPTAIEVDLADGLLSVSYPRSYPGCHPDSDFVWAADSDVAPEAIRREYPIFPEEARRFQTAGAVFGSYVVGTDGSVMDVCIVAVEPPNYGFGPSAAEAQRRGVYKPAIRAGRPVAVAMMFFTTFEMNMSGSPASVLAQAYFNSVRMRTSAP